MRVQGFGFLGFKVLRFLGLRCRIPRVFGLGFLRFKVQDLGGICGVAGRALWAFRRTLYGGVREKLLGVVKEKGILLFRA